MNNFIIQKVQDHILTEENLQDLVRLTKEAIEKEKGEDDRALKIVDQQIAEIDRKLGRLYDILETGELTVADIAPRLKEHKAEREELAKVRNELLEGIESRKPLQISVENVQRYVENLQELLKCSEIGQIKEFFRSFIQSIIIDYPEVVVNYRFPVSEVVNYGMAQKKGQINI